MTKSAYLPYGRAGSALVCSPLLRVHGILSYSYALVHVHHAVDNSQRSTEGSIAGTRSYGKQVSSV